MVPRPSRCATSSRRESRRAMTRSGAAETSTRMLLTVAGPLANAQGISDFLATLKPATDAQKTALATAQQYSSMVEQSRLLMSLQVASGPVSWVLIAILVFWTAALFFGIGLYAEFERSGRRGPYIRSPVDRVCDPPHPRARHAVYGLVPGFTRRARADDRVYRQIAAPMIALIRAAAGRRMCAPGSSPRRSVRRGL